MHGSSSSDCLLLLWFVRCLHQHGTSFAYLPFAGAATAVHPLYAVLILLACVSTAVGGGDDFSPPFSLLRTDRRRVCSFLWNVSIFIYVSVIFS